MLATSEPIPMTLKRNNNPGLTPMLWNMWSPVTARDQEIVDQVNDEVAQEGVAAQPRIAGGDGHLDAHRGDNEALVQGDANPEEERGPVGVAQLVRARKSSAAGRPAPPETTARW